MLKLQGCIPSPLATFESSRWIFPTSQLRWRLAPQGIPPYHFVPVMVVVDGGLQQGETPNHQGKKHTHKQYKKIAEHDRKQQLKNTCN